MVSLLTIYIPSLFVKHSYRETNINRSSDTFTNQITSNQNNYCWPQVIKIICLIAWQLKQIILSFKDNIPKASINSRHKNIKRKQLLPDELEGARMDKQTPPECVCVAATPVQHILNSTHTKCHPPPTAPYTRTHTLSHTHTHPHQLHNVSSS